RVGVENGLVWALWENDGGRGAPFSFPAASLPLPLLPRPAAAVGRSGLSPNVDFSFLARLERRAGMTPSASASSAPPPPLSAAADAVAPSPLWSGAADDSGVCCCSSSASS
ncbi:unnamed protein product, partial [Ectocarpus sp. 12 AP-2014]